MFIDQLKSLARNTGSMTLIRQLAKKAAGLIDYALLHQSRAPENVWVGLMNYPFRTILDIGACHGGYAEEILRPRFPGATIHSFEPSPTVFAKLKQVAARSDGWIVAHNYGLGEQAETLTLHSTIDLLPASSVLASTETNTLTFPVTKRTEDIEVQIRALDEVAALLSPAIDVDLLIKIDVQGFEDRVVRGGRQTIKRARAAIIEIQVADLYVSQPSFRDIFLEMDHLGFAFAGVLDQYTDMCGRVLYFDAVFLKD